MLLKKSKSLHIIFTFRASVMANKFDRTWKVSILTGTVVLMAGMVVCIPSFLAPSSHGNVVDNLASTELDSESFASSIAKFAFQHLQQHHQNQLLQTDLSERQLIARFLDPTTAFALRKLDAWRLAVLDSEQARDALLNVLQTGNEEMQAAVAEMLGHSRWPRVRALLAGLLVEPNRVVAGGAVAGLVLLADDDAVQLLRSQLLNQSTDADLRRLIALRLADVQTRAALEALKSAFASPDLPLEIRQQVVVSLGRFPFAQTADVFRGVIDNPDVSNEFKVEAVEALTDAGQAALPFLTDLVSQHEDAEVRASAAWAVGMHPETGRLGEQLTESVKTEADTEVRRRLYESLMRQDIIPADQLLDNALSETNTATRVAAANMLAVAVGQAESSQALQQRFDTDAVPALQAIALGDDSVNVRYRAVFALIRAGTESALSALEEIERHGEPQVASLAGRGVARHNP